MARNDQRRRRRLTDNPLADFAVWLGVFAAGALVLVAVVMSVSPAKAKTPASLLIDAGVVLVFDPPADLRCDMRGWNITSPTETIKAVRMDAVLSPAGMAVTPAIEVCVMRDGYEGF